jgi:hypothetical protein
MSAQILQFRKLKPIDEEYHNLIEKLEYYNDCLISYETVISQDGDNLLAGMSNIFGKHQKDTKNKFLSFINNPCPETWKNIRNYLIDSTTTSWQLWARFDSNAPNCIMNEADSFIHPTGENFIIFFNKHKEQRLYSLKKIILDVETEIANYRIN